MTNIHKIKQEICDIGKRIYQKGYAAANDGNISYRADENQVVCTPTLVCKGFLTPDDLCVVDMQGKQIGGRRKHTSEVKLHLTIMKERPEIKAVVHCHPPHATAFGIAREPIPQCVLPEVEIFLGDVPIAKYALPGSQEFADTILPFVHKTNVIILANHGTVSFGETVEKAYWWTEILDSYCRILMLARGLGRVNYFSEPEAKALLDLKEHFGMKDPRTEMKNCELCGNDVFRESWKQTGVCPTAFQPPKAGGDKSSSALSAFSNGSAPVASAIGKLHGNIDQEALIQAITDRVMQMLNS
jgi:L-fuculose-phosphate aldolase